MDHLDVGTSAISSFATVQQQNANVQCQQRQDAGLQNHRRRGCQSKEAPRLDLHIYMLKQVKKKIHLRTTVFRVEKRIEHTDL